MLRLLVAAALCIGNASVLRHGDPEHDSGSVHGTLIGEMRSSRVGRFNVSRDARLIATKEWTQAMYFCLEIPKKSTPGDGRPLYLLACLDPLSLLNISIDPSTH